MGDRARDAAGGPHPVVPLARVTTHSAAAEQAWNDAALAQPVAAPVWRLWRYAEPAVVLGRSQRGWLATTTAVADVAGASLPVLVRSAGGGAVLVGPWMIGLSAALPPAHPLAGDAPVAGYRWLGEAIAGALQHVGLGDARALSPETLRARGVVAAPDWACFGGLSPWEVVLGERKIAGLAQVRRRTGVLCVAGVLVAEPPWERLCQALGRPDGEAARLRGATTVCAAHLTPPMAAAASLEAVARALADAISAYLRETQPGAAPSAPAPEPAPARGPVTSSAAAGNSTPPLRVQDPSVPTG